MIKKQEIDQFKIVEEFNAAVLKHNKLLVHTTQKLQEICLLEREVKARDDTIEKLNQNLRQKMMEAESYKNGFDSLHQSIREKPIGETLEINQKYISICQNKDLKKVLQSIKGYTENLDNYMKEAISKFQNINLSENDKKY